MNVDRRVTAEVFSKRSLVNGKPYRSAAMKAKAKKEAAVRSENGAWRCDTVPVKYHRGAER